MISRGNPISIDVLATLNENNEELILRQVKEQLIPAIKGVDNELMGWLRKQAELVKLRLGYRKPRNIPWRGASNISVPLIDGIIRRWRPGIASLVLDADPVAFFTATDANDFEAARQAEVFFNYLLLGYMNVTYDVVQLVDLIAWRGHAYTREGWAYKTIREARVVPVAHLFPNGLEQTIQESQALAVQQGQEPPSPEDIVVSALEAEYGLDRNSRSEGPMLLAVAQRILGGAEYVKLVYRKVKTDRPDWKPIDPLNVIVPQEQNPEDAEFFCVIHHMNRDQLRGMAIDGHLPRGRVEELLESLQNPSRSSGSDEISDGMRKTIQDIKDRVAGKEDASTTQGASNTRPIPIWEISAFLDINGDGERERCIVWWAPQTETLLTVLDYPYPFDTWQYTYYPFEAAARPIDNRGIADMLRPLAKIVNAYHNARIDAAQIVLAPVLVARATQGRLKSRIKWHPGSVIPVQNVNDIQPLVQNMQILNGLLQEEQVNQRLAETYVGVFDATLTNLQARGERRTAAEVNAIQGLSSNIFGLDAKIVQVAFGKSFTKLWQLYVDLGPQELFFRVTGEEQVRQARKVDLARNFDIRAAGTPANTNRTFQIAALERVMASPLALPLMQAGRLDGAKLFENWVKLVDYNLARAIVRPAEESAAAQQILQAAQLAGQQLTGDNAGIAPIL